jgi:hypothetical protein
VPSFRRRTCWPLTNPVTNSDRNIASRFRCPRGTICCAFASRHRAIHTHPVSLHLSNRFAHVAMGEPDKASEADHCTNQNCYRHLDHSDRRNLAHFARDSAQTSRRDLSGLKDDVRAWSGCSKKAARKARFSRRRAHTISSPREATHPYRKLAPRTKSLFRKV